MKASGHTGSALILLLTLTALTGTTIPSNAGSRTVYEAALLQDGVQGIRKGTILTSIDGMDLRLFGAYFGLGSYVTGGDLYVGDPNDGGEQIESLFIGYPSEHDRGGGFDRTTTLTQQHLDELLGGNLYFVLQTVYSADRLIGRLQVVTETAPEFVETTLWQRHAIPHGRVRAVATPEGIRIVGFFHNLGSSWGRIGLYRGALGSEGELIGYLDNYSGEFRIFDGFDVTFSPDPAWEDELRTGMYYVQVHTGRLVYDLRGQLLSATNRPPAASELLMPDDGEVVVVGGAEGEDPVDPAVYLGMISFTEVEDPDADAVAYLWQASLRDDFAGQTMTFELGVDSTRLHLTVARAAALVDSLSRMQFGGKVLHTPAIIYHRVYTTDGALYSVSESRQMTLIRGQITSADREAEIPLGIALRGNYPNPFNPSTTVIFDLPATAHVSLDVFDPSGRNVLSVPERPMPAGSTRQIEIDASSLASGMYLYRIRARSEAGTALAGGRMLLVK